MRCFKILAALLVTIVIERSSDAGVVFGTHAVVGGYTLSGGSGPNVPGEQIRIEGNGILSASLADFWDGYGTVPSFSGDTAAATSPFTDVLLKAKSDAVGTGAGSYNGGGYGDAWSAWRDVAFVANATPLDTIRATFVVDGSLTTLRTANYNNPVQDAKLGIWTTTNPTTFFQAAKFFYDPAATYHLSNSPLEIVKETNSAGTSVKASGQWDSVISDGLNVIGTFHIDLAYNSQLGGYGWGVAMHADSQAFGGAAESNFFNTLKLQSVTLADGTPADVTFDSGLQFGSTATPEPSSFVIFGTLFGCFSLNNWRIKRGKKGDAT